ncbi:hypothetical protein CU097_011418 [Rhizopus azygosporus]|uniref:Uncharacterized protein n=1 Tax=Rhizopus azygosporus TaxID=86630 RepID=A0A367JJ37_RHIAZ|nr:hypothetical protein CU097_011418 [Rhizopus azygosporus]
MAQWIRRLTTNQEIPGSTPGSLTSLFFTPRSRSFKTTNRMPAFNLCVVMNTSNQGNGKVRPDQTGFGQDSYLCR